MIVRETINFERGQDPKRTMNIGLKTWDNIQPGDLLVLKGESFLDKPLRNTYIEGRDLVYLIINVRKFKDRIEFDYWGCIGIPLAIITREESKTRNRSRGREDFSGLGRFILEGTKEQFDKTFRIIQAREEEEIMENN